MQFRRAAHGARCARGREGVRVRGAHFARGGEKGLVRARALLSYARGRGRRRPLQSLLSGKGELVSAI